MKFKIIISTLLLTSLVTAACKKKNKTTSSNSHSESYGTSVIRGKVSAELNVLTNGNEDVTAGTIIAEISTQDLINNPSSGTVFENRLFSGPIQSDGSYSIVVDANVKPVNVKIYPQDIEYNKVVSATAPTTQRTVYTSPVFNVVVVKGGTKVIDILYN